MRVEWIDVPEQKPLPVYGVRNNAEIVITVEIVGAGTLDDPAEKVVTVDCLCAACYEIDMAGVPEYVEEMVGVHYMKAWHETIQYAEGIEHDGGLMHTEVTDDE